MTGPASSTVLLLTADELARFAAAHDATPVPDVYAVRTRWRKRAGLHHYAVTQAGFAALLGVPPTTVRDWEQGRRVPYAAARRLLLLFAAVPDEMRAALERLADRRNDGTAVEDLTEANMAEPIQRAPNVAKAARIITARP